MIVEEGLLLVCLVAEHKHDFGPGSHGKMTRKPDVARNLLLFEFHAGSGFDASDEAADRYRAEHLDGDLYPLKRRALDPQLPAHASKRASAHAPWLISIARLCVQDIDFVISKFVGAGHGERKGFAEFENKLGGMLSLGFILGNAFAPLGAFLPWRRDTVAWNFCSSSAC